MSSANTPAIQLPRHYHRFTLNRLWIQLVQTLFNDNKNQNVELLQIPNLTPAKINILEKATKTQMTAETAWNNCQAHKNKSFTLFSTHQELLNSKALWSTMRKLQPWYKPNGKFDLQSLYLFLLNGVNEPQYFIKGTGAWTALHGEDCGLGSFNINFGPGTSKWTIISCKEIDKINKAIKKELKLKGKFDIRDHWHQYYLSIAFLKEYNIDFEHVYQKPGQAIFVPGQSLHQVVSIGYELSVAWNILAFCWDSIHFMVESYDFELKKQKKIPVVPVPRILHGLLVGKINQMNSNELVYLAYRLLDYLQIDEQVHEKFKKRKYAYKTDSVHNQYGSLINNGCSRCTMAIYLRYYEINDHTTEDFLCGKCAITIASKQSVISKQLIDIVKFKEHLTNIKNQKVVKASSDLKLDNLMYPGQKLDALQRMDYHDPLVTTLELFRSKRKMDHVRLQINELNNAISRHTKEMKSTKSLLAKRELQTAINKKLDKIHKLKRFKDL